MYKRILLGLMVVLLIVLAIVVRFFFSNTHFSEKSRILYIHTGKTGKKDVLNSMKEHRLIRNPASFDFLAGQMKTWARIRPGRYEIRKGMSLFDISRMLRNGNQAPLNLTIIKLRTAENLASLVGKKFETDSTAMMAFLTNNDSLKKYGLDSLTVMTAVFPDTYTYLWTTSPDGIFRKLYAQYKKIWNDERRKKAELLGLDPVKAYILASIIEEETTYDKEKGLMASVYLNRLARNMNLGADPTVKFALRDFTLKRIYEKHLATESPYNTYRNKGLPPGPICTPSLVTLDAVLDAPQTDYLFFVAKKDFSQGHIFTTKYREHLKYAREYQKALSRLERERSIKAREDIRE